MEPVEKLEVIDTANVIGADLGEEIIPNQSSFSRMEKGDVLYFPMLAMRLDSGEVIHTPLVAPKGATSVPEEYEIQYFKATFE